MLLVVAMKDSSISSISCLACWAFICLVIGSAHHTDNPSTCMHAFNTVLCMCAGLPTYLCGCDPTIDPGCIRYNNAVVKIIDYEVRQHTCSYCAYTRQSCSQSCSTTNGKRSCSTTCTTYCARYVYYECYNSYAIASFELRGNRTCSLR